MIYNVPDPPPGSKITVERDAYELRLSWGGRRSTGRLVLSVVGSVVMAVAGSAMQFVGLSGPQTWALTFVVVSLLMGFVATLVRDYRALRPETLVLGLDTLTHAAGGKNSSAAPSGPPLTGFHWGRSPGRRAVARADVGDFGSGSRDGRAFATMQVAEGGAIELGWGLDDADREWLVSVLRRWKESAG